MPLNLEDWISYAIGAVILFGLFEYYLEKRSWLKIQHAQTKQNLKLLKKMSLLKGGYRAPFWGTGLLLTISTDYRSAPEIEYERMIISGKEQDELQLSYNITADIVIDSNLTEISPIVVISPGICGSSKNKYIRNLSINLVRAGFRPIIWNHRGCNADLSSEALFSKGGWEDLSRLVPKLKERYSNNEFHAIGLSMGGNILLNYLSLDKSSSSIFTSAISIGQNYDVKKAIDELESGRSMLRKFCCKILTKKMIKMMKEHPQIYNKSSLIDFDELQKATTLTEFDKNFTLKIYPEWESVDNYYKKSSCIHHFHNIEIPVLLLNANDDPIFPGDQINSKEITKKNENFIHVLSSHGGHISHFRTQKFNPFSLQPVSWLEELSVEFLSATTSVIN